MLFGYFAVCVAVVGIALVLGSIPDDSELLDD